MSDRKRILIYLVGTIPLGLLAAAQYPVGGRVGMVVLLGVYIFAVLPWAMGGRWRLWEKPKEED